MAERRTDQHDLDCHLPPFQRIAKDQGKIRCYSTGDFLQLFNSSPQIEVPISVKYASLRASYAKKRFVDQAPQAM